MRLIDADALKDKISSKKLRVKNPNVMAGLVEMQTAALREIENAPTIEPEVLLIPKEVSATDIDKLTEMIKCSLLQAYPNDAVFTAVRHGRWECGGFCSECGIDNEERKTDYCPNCGAKMDGGDNNG